MQRHEKREEHKLNQRVHRVFKQKGWENEIKSEENVFTFNTGDNYLEVTFKDDPYYKYQYDIDDNKVKGDAILKDKYIKDAKHYEHFKKKYELK